MSVLKTLWSGLRATAFWLGLIIVTVIYLPIIPFLYFLPYEKRYAVLVKWGTIALYWLQLTCGVHYRVQGRENIPVEGAAIIMSNHQSTWETLAFATIFPPLTWVLKKELFKIPVFGWGLSMIRPVGIDRGAGRSAVDQVKVQGKDRLDEGIWIVVFPEGTRVKPGVKVRYKIGGAVLAGYSGYPILPVAHNAGQSWPRGSYIKKPGVITISIGKPIVTTRRKPEAILKDVEDWIEGEKSRLVFEER